MTAFSCIKWPSSRWRQACLEAVLWLPLWGWLLAWAAFFPGFLTSDSVDQWLQAGRRELHDYHPIGHTALMQLTRAVWDSPGALVLLQIVASYALLRFTWRLASRLQVPLAWRSAQAVFVACYPLTLLFPLEVWKDIPFSLAGALLVLFVAEAALDPGFFFQRFRRRLCWVFAASLMMVATRHNGWPLVIGVAVALGWLAPKRRLWVALCVTLVWPGSILLREAITRANLSVTHYSPNLGSGYLAAHVAAGTPTDASEALLLSRIAPLNQDWGYTCENDAWVFSPKVRVGVIGKHPNEYRALLWALTWRNPRATFEHFACASSIIWRLSARGPTQSLPFSVRDDRVVHVYEFEEAVKGSPVAQSLLPRCRDSIGLLLDRATGALGWLIWLPAMWLYLLLGAGLASAARAGTPRVLAILVPVCLHSAALAVVVPSQCPRYMYVVTLSAILLLPILMHLWRTRGARRGVQF